ncbi:hypothetical protein PM082_018631 [Marasmius tenuissimus]|nr:hypothetical protein PM082_018631 [Marasmius tenuissimus]
MNSAGFEYWADPNNRDSGEVTWHVDDVPSVQLRPPAVGPDKGVGGGGVSQRIIPEEPMSIIFNLGMSTNWATPKLDTLVFPAEMLFDYVHEPLTLSGRKYPRPSADVCSRPQPSATSLKPLSTRNPVESKWISGSQNKTRTGLNHSLFTRLPANIRRL